MEKAKFTLRIDENLLKEIKVLAIMHDMPLNQLIVDALFNYISTLCEE